MISAHLQIIFDTLCHSFGHCLLLHVQASFQGVSRVLFSVGVIDKH